MTLDDLIEKAQEAKEHCVPGNTDVNVWLSDMTNLTAKDKLVGTLSWIDYDNAGINLYYEEQ